MAYLSPDDVDSIGDDDISAILGLNQNASQQDKLTLQQKLASALRNKSPDRGQSVPQGSVFLPPNPLTSAMDIFDHLQGIAQGTQAVQQGKDLDTQRQAALEKFYKLLQKKGKASTPQVGSDQSSSDDPNDPTQGLM